LLDKETQFAKLVSEAAACIRCPAMCERAAVLSHLNGPLCAPVMFIGEAPGRKGADRTRIPFSGDQSGRNFERFLDSINLKRTEIFITSAALCNPRSATGANRKPTTEKSATVPAFKANDRAVDPQVIVTLGSVALER
jgi:uracil-DNA glycosylase family 4